MVGDGLRRAAASQTEGGGRRRGRWVGRRAVGRGWRTASGRGVADKMRWVAARAVGWSASSWSRVADRVGSRRRRQDAVGGGAGGRSVGEQLVEGGGPHWVAASQTRCGGRRRGRWVGPRTARGVWQIVSYHGVADENGTATELAAEFLHFLLPHYLLFYRIFPCWPPFSSHRQKLTTRGRAARKWEQPLEPKLGRRWMGHYATSW